jgi:hypothetical protein
VSKNNASVIDRATIILLNITRTKLSGSKKKRRKPKKNKLELQLRMLKQLKKKQLDLEKKLLEMPRPLKNRKRELLTWLRALGLKTKKKLLLKKNLEEKNGIKRVYLTLMPLKRKNYLPKTPDIKQEELKECIKELLKLKREQMLSIRLS